MADASPSALPLTDPLTGDVLSHGMTLRDWFAGQIAAQLVRRCIVLEDWGRLPSTAYEIADAMLVARENSNG